MQHYFNPCYFTRGSGERKGTFPCTEKWLNLSTYWQSEINKWTCFSKQFFQPSITSFNTSFLLPLSEDIQERESQMKTIRVEWPSRGGTRSGGSDSHASSWEREEYLISQEQRGETDVPVMLGSMSPAQWMLLLPLKICYTRKIKGGREKKRSGNWGSMCSSSHVFQSNTFGTSSRNRWEANRQRTGAKLRKGAQVLLVAKAIKYGWIWSQRESKEDIPPLKSMDPLKYHE